MGRTGLVVGGTGMLAGCVSMLAGDGWDLVLPSRQRPRDGAAPGRWVRADWADPAEFARLIADRAAEPMGVLVAWVHSPHREPVLRAIDGVAGARRASGRGVG